MEQVCALQIDVRAHARREPLRMVERCRATHVRGKQVIQLAAEGGIRSGIEPRLLECRERRHQGLGDVLAPIGAEALLEAGPHQTGVAARSTDWKKRSSFFRSLRPSSA